MDARAGMVAVRHRQHGTVGALQRFDLYQGDGCAPWDSDEMEFDAELVRRFGHRGPRYTSYPTADRFVEAFGPEAYRASVARRNTGGAQRSLALYVHLPFCRDLCFYCACNKIVTRDTGKAARYLEYLTREIDMQAALFREDTRVSHMHWGGGTPTFYGVSDLAVLWNTIGSRFNVMPDACCAIEVDPRSVDGAVVAELRAIGFNRISLGIQDFDRQVQLAINRVQDEEHTLSVLEAARRASFTSINADLIYGLPKQTPASFERTLLQVISAAPDRIALYAYAHLPAAFKAQKHMIPDGDLPSPEERLQLFGLALGRLGMAGYLHIGMDHFARPHDELAVAQRQGLLRRDFQGYSTGVECDLAGLGVSAIGAVGPTYSQNHRFLKDYYDRLDRGELPIMRGIELDRDDLVRRAVIQALMCQFALSREAVGAAYLIDFDRYFAPELEALREFQDCGLLELDEDWLTITPKGRFVIRGICAVFDRYLQHNGDGGRYSRLI